MHYDLQMWIQFFYLFATATLLQPVEVHLYPWWYATDEGHILIDGLVDNLAQLGFPVFYTIGFV